MSSPKKETCMHCEEEMDFSTDFFKALKDPALYVYKRPENEKGEIKEKDKRWFLEEPFKGWIVCDKCGGRMQVQQRGEVLYLAKPVMIRDFSGAPPAEGWILRELKRETADLQSVAF